MTLPSGTTVSVPKAQSAFKEWRGTPVEDSYGNKPVLSFGGEPVFAELAILRMFQSTGWDGVWVDTYRKKFRTSYWPKDEAVLPSGAVHLFDQICEKAGSRNGCWDVFCWKGDAYCFAEAKWQGHDRIRETQRRWLEAALKSGLSVTSFLIVEWGKDLAWN